MPWDGLETQGPRDPQGRMEHEGPEDHQGPRESEVTKAWQVPPAGMVFQDPGVHLAPRALWGNLARMATRAMLELPERRASRVVRASRVLRVQLDRKVCEVLQVPMGPLGSVAPRA